MRCQKCYGSGTIMGKGMIYEDCDCQYTQFNEKNTETEPNKVQIDKRSKMYREAIGKIMHENKMTKDAAMRLFEEEFYKIA